MQAPDQFFFFSSRRRHTRCGRDWSSDVSLPIWEDRAGPCTAGPCSAAGCSAVDRRSPPGGHGDLCPPGGERRSTALQPAAEHGLVQQGHVQQQVAVLWIDALPQAGTDRRARLGESVDPQHCNLLLNMALLYKAQHDLPRSEETRLNSSHVRISYAVFCLKKKKKTNYHLLLRKKKTIKKKQTNKN